MTNLLKNPGFELGSSNADLPNNIFTPDDWKPFWLIKKGVPHDQENTVGYSQIEMEVIKKQHPYLNPPRVRADEQALKFFTFNRIHKAGIYQVVKNLQPGDLLEAGGFAHAWSSTDDDAKTSDNATESDRLNMTFCVGVDPWGGTDPWSDSVIWGEPVNIYNTYGPLPNLDVEAKANQVTFFFLSDVLWPFKHCDVYADSFYLRRIEFPGPTESPSPSPSAPIPSQPDDGYKRSIVSVHTVGDSGFLELLQKLDDDWIRLTSMKAYASVGVLEDALEIDPTIITMGRFTKGIHDIDVEGPDLSGDLKHQAELVMASVMPMWRKYPKVKYWEITNEHDPEYDIGWLRYANFFLHCMDIAEANGFHIALPSSSYGVPEYSEMKIFASTGILKRMKDGDHVFSIHEYSRPMDLAMGEAIPGATANPSRGPYAFRFRFWEDFCPDGEMPDVYITEWNFNGDIRNLTLDDWYDQLLWYAKEAAKSYYVKGLHCFTWGAENEWEGFCISTERQKGMFENLIRATATLEGSSPSPSPSPSEPIPSDWPYNFPPYHKRYNVVEADILPDRKAYIYNFCAERDETVGPAATDAVTAATEIIDAGFTVTIVPWDRNNPAEWVAWARKQDPRIIVEFAGYTGGQGNPENVIPFTQQDERWKDIHLGTSIETMGSAGCLVTAITSRLTPDIPLMLPRDLVELLNANNGFTSAGNLYMQKPADLIAELELIRYQKWGTTGQNTGIVLVRDALSYGPTIVRVDYIPESLDIDNHFVVAIREDTTKDDMWIMDPWDGEFKWLREEFDRGSLTESLFGIADYRMIPMSPPPVVDTLIGINDPENTGAGPWLCDKGGGLLVVPLAIEGAARPMDFTAYAECSVRVVVNLRWSWSKDFGYNGTMPLPDTYEWHRFIEHAADTINYSEGVYAWTIGNEYNNPREFPQAGDLTPNAVVRTYNAIRERVPNARMGPGAVDPFNAQAGDPADWVDEIYSGVNGVEIIGMHGYIRGPDPNQVGSNDKFTDDPLKYQYLNYSGCVEMMLEAIPIEYDDVPIYITEFNHIYKDGGETDFGWVTDQRAHDVVKRAFGAAEICGYSGLAIYRWSGDDWAMGSNNAVLGAIDEILAL